MTVWRDSGSKVTHIGLVVLALLGAFMMGRYALDRPELALFPLVLPLLPVVIKEPLAGLLIYFPLTALLPYWVRLPLPLLGSPYALVAMGTTLAALMHLVSSRPRLPRSPLYLFIALAEIILISGAVSHHGPESFWRFYDFSQGILFLVLVLILVDTPRKARWVLAAIAGTPFLRMFVQLPVAIAYADTSKGALRTFHMGVPNRWWEFLVGDSPSFVWMLTMAVPLLIALWPVIQEPRWRRRIGLLLTVTLIFLVITTQRANLLNLALGFGAVVLLSPRRHRRSYLALIVIGIAIIALIIWLTAAGRHTLSLWTETLRDLPAQGPSTDRLWYLKGGLRLFRFSPFVGIGAATPKRIAVPETPLLGPSSSLIEVQGHSALAMVAYEYGVVYLIAWLGMLLTAARNMLWLHRHVHDPFDRALVTGLLGGWAVFAAMGILNTAWLVVPMSQIFWAGQGLVVLWSDWLQRDVKARLVA